MTSFLDRLKKRAGATMGGGRPLFDRIKPAEKVRQTVVTNRWDEESWDRARGSKQVDDLIHDLTTGDQHKADGERPGYGPAPELVKDLYFTFYKANPRLEKRADVLPEVRNNHAIIEELMANPKLQELQDITAGDPMMAIVAVDSMGSTVREIITRMPPPPPPPMPKPKKQKQQKQEQSQDGEGQPGEGGQPGQGQQDPNGGQGQGQGGAQGAAPAQPDPNGQNAGQGQQGGGQPQEGDEPEPGDENQDVDLETDGDQEFDGDQEMDDGELDWEKEFEEGLADLDLDRMVNKALEQAAEEVEDLDTLAKGIGLDEGDWKTMSPEQRFELAAKLRTPEMKILADVIGRMKRFAMGVRARRIVDVPHEAYDVEHGNRLADVLNCELALLADDDTELEFLRKFANGELLQYKKRGTEEVGKGPIVIAIDKSGSMYGEPFNWAMAVAEALRRFAAEEDRDIYVMFFGNNNDRERFDFPKGKAEPEKLMTFLSCQANGGTQFDGVLTESLQRASTAFDREARGKADIVFITDGQAPLDEGWIKDFNTERERVGVRVYSVYIGGAYDMDRKTGPLALLQKISDATIPVKELKPQAVEQIFARV